MSELKRNIPSLDGLRAISILLVVLSHASWNYFAVNQADMTRLGSIIQVSLLTGTVGVTVFFVISGFLITTLLLKEDKISLKRFYFRRTLRIFPPFYVYLICMVTLRLAGFIDTPASDFVRAFTYTSNYGFHPQANNWSLAHTWSLSVEEQFYLLFPATLVLFGRKKILLVLALVVITAPLFRLLYLQTDPANLYFFGFETVADALAMGCILAITRSWLHRQKFYTSVLQSPFFILMPFLALFIAWLSHFPAYYPKSLYVVFAITMQNAAIALCLDWSITNSGSLVGRILNMKYVVFIGTISYSLYLWQQPVFSTSLELPLFVKIIAAFGLAMISYYLVEKPSLRLRKYLEGKYMKPDLGQANR